MTKAYVSQDSFAKALDVEALEERLVGVGYEVVPVGGYGLAWLEPLVEIESSNERLAFSNVQPEDISGSSCLDRSHAKFAGQVNAQSFYEKQQRLVFDRCGLTPTTTFGETNALLAVLAQSQSDIIDAIEIANLRGRGGAGFPAHIKWRTVLETEADQKFVVCNADEGDSGTFSDRMLMEGDPFRLIEGMIISGYATGATRGFIYLRSEYPYALATLRAAIDEAYDRAMLGENLLDTGFSFDLEIMVGAGAYICGEETSLLESLEGKRGQIRIKPPVPAIAGLRQKPTLVHNVITLGSVPGIFRIGAENYRELGVYPSTGTMPFQISGNIKHGGLIEIPFGSKVRELVEGFGQGTLSGRAVRAVQIGGPLGAYLSQNELDTPLTYEAMEAIGAGIGHGGLVVFDDTIDLAEQAEFAFHFCAIESCGKCTPCRIGAVRGRETMQQIRLGHNVAEKLQLVEDLCEVMDSASLCLLGGMTPIPVRSAMERFPEDFSN